MKRNLNKNLFLRNSTQDELPLILSHTKEVQDESIVGVVRSIFTKKEYFSLNDSFLIYDTENDKIAAHLILNPFLWEINGVEISCAEMEFVATKKEYRRQGLIYHLSDAFDQRSKERNCIIQVIGGIQFFYKQFGYNYGAPSGELVFLFPQQIPILPEGQSEPVTIEKVSKEDFNSYIKFRKDFLPKNTWCRQIKAEEFDYYTYEEISPSNRAHAFYFLKHENKVVGIFHIGFEMNGLALKDVCLVNFVHFYSILRFLLKKVEDLKSPILIYKPYQIQLRDTLASMGNNGFQGIYAWYIKIPSILRFLETIGPLLTKRLKDSEFHQFSGILGITTYKRVFFLKFKNGELSEVSEVEFDPENLTTGIYHLFIPQEMLYQLLMGYKTLNELKKQDLDIIISVYYKSIFEIIFPKLDANITPPY